MGKTTPVKKPGPSKGFQRSPNAKLLKASAKKSTKKANKLYSEGAGTGETIIVVMNNNASKAGFYAITFAHLRNHPEKMADANLHFIGTRRDGEPDEPMMQEPTSTWTFKALVNVANPGTNDATYRKNLTKSVAKLLTKESKGLRYPQEFEYGGDMTNDEDPRVLDQLLIQEDNITIIRTLFLTVAKEELAGDEEFLRGYFGSLDGDIRRGQELIEQSEDNSDGDDDAVPN